MTGGILERILADKQLEVASRRRERPQDVVEAAARAAPAPRPFIESLRAAEARFRVIAEVKRASPSKGTIREDFDPVSIARAYEESGAGAISVLTDEKYFQGHLDFLVEIRRAVRLPLLRKDFVIDPYQVYESRAAGADAILLIAAASADDQLAALSRLASELGMDVLWEVHDEDELARIARFGPRLVGINNRDLTTFAVSLDTTRRLLPRIPAGALSVSESGFSRRDELEELDRWGVGAFLIGESLMRQPDPGRALRELLRAESAASGGTS